MSPSTAAIPSVPRVGTVTELLTAVASHRPIVVPIGLLMERGTGDLASLDAFGHAFAPLALELHQNYLDGSVASLVRYLRTGDDADMQDYVDDPARCSTVEEYVASMRAGTTEGWVAVEQPSPAAIVAALGRIGEGLAALGVETIVAGSTTRKGAAGSYVYLAPAGQFSDLHFDRDGTHVLNLQMFGRKRFTLFPPAAGRFLCPIMHWGGVKLRGLSPERFAGFLAYAGGANVELQPGEAIYIPPFYWHHIEYLDHALGVGIRFGPPGERVRRVLAGVHPDHRLQAIAAHVLQHLPAGELGPLDELEPLVLASDLSPAERHARIDGWLAEQVERMQLLEGQEPVAPSTDFAAHVLEAFYLRHAAPVEVASNPVEISDSSTLRLAADLRLGRFEAHGFHAWREDAAGGGARLAYRVLDVLIRFGGDGASKDGAGLSAGDRALVDQLVQLGLLEPAPNGPE